MLAARSTMPTTRSTSLRWKSCADRQGQASPEEFCLSCRVSLATFLL